MIDPQLRFPNYARKPCGIDRSLGKIDGRRDSRRFDPVKALGSRMIGHGRAYPDSFWSISFRANDQKLTEN